MIFNIKIKVSKWEHLAKIYGRYPFTEVIIHARLREEYYGGSPHTEAMETALSCIKSPVCYNGDIFDNERVRLIRQKFPQINKLMIGRGALKDPLIFEKLKVCGKNDGYVSYESGSSNADAQDISISDADFGNNNAKLRVFDFMEELFDTYMELFGSPVNTLFHMKELWSYLGTSYPGMEKCLKLIRKTKSVAEYKSAVREILRMN